MSYRQWSNRVDSWFYEYPVRWSLGVGALASGIIIGLDFATSDGTWRNVAFGLAVGIFWGPVFIFIRHRRDAGG